jgi:hypothetical protein
MPASKAATRPDITALQLKSVCRRHVTNREAAQALGINSATLAELCRELEIKSPYERKLGGWR